MTLLLTSKKRFSTEEILKHHINDCFEINDKQKIIMPQKGEYVKSKNYEREVKSPFIIYQVCESILVPENNEKVNSRKVLQKQISKTYCLQL